MSIDLSEDAEQLLAEAVQDSNGMIRKIATFGGLGISTHGKSFTEMGNRRSEARWEQALLELLNHGLVQDPTGKGQIFEVTHRGFQAADDKAG